MIIVKNEAKVDIDSINFKNVNRKLGKISKKI